MFNFSQQDQKQRNSVLTQAKEWRKRQEKAKKYDKSTTDRFCNFPKQTIRHSHPPHASTGRVCGGEKLRRFLTSLSSFLFVIFYTTISVIFHVNNIVLSFFFFLLLLSSQSTTPLMSENMHCFLQIETITYLMHLYFGWPFNQPAEFDPSILLIIKRGRTTLLMNYFCSSITRP